MQLSSLGSDDARCFSNQCNIYEVEKVVHGNLLDSCYNWSDKWSSVLQVELY